jgi:uncharacterized membrane protein YkvA (DUF1232 family)
MEHAEEGGRVKISDSLQVIRRGLAREIRTYRLVLAHPRCPRRAKVLLSLALAYLAMPFDLIPDFIPIIGHLDDAVVVPGLVWLALRSIPKEVIEDCRKRAMDTRQVERNRIDIDPHRPMR